MFKQTIAAGLKSGTFTQQDLLKVNVDTRMQEKAIEFPTDAKLYHKMREKLVEVAKKVGATSILTLGETK